MLIEIGGSLAELQSDGRWFSDSEVLQTALVGYGLDTPIPIEIYHPDPRVRLALYVCSVYGGTIVQIPSQRLPPGAIG